MIGAGDLATFRPDHRGYAHRAGQTVMVMHCLDARPDPHAADDGLDRLWQVKTAEGLLLLAFESELSRSTAAVILAAASPAGTGERPLSVPAGLSLEEPAR